MRHAVFILCLFVTGLARGVIVQGGDGTGNTTGTNAGSGWNYVGSVGGASGVFLGGYDGSYWVLTAGHVGAGTFTLNDTSYAAVAGSEITLTNDDGSTADLKLFRIDGGPEYVPLTLASSAPALGASLTMIGNGVGREAAETHWNFSWIETSSPIAIHEGYKWSDPRAKRWGRNTVSGYMEVSYSNGVTTETLTTRFQQQSGSAQATSGDSGGGVFLANGTLAGIMIAVTSPEAAGQPGSTSVYGNLTYTADVSAYRSQILGIISPVAVPEPNVPALLAMAIFAVVWRLRKAPAVPR
jgi:hypothetical protein